MIYIDDHLQYLSTEELDKAIAKLPEQRRKSCLKYKYELGRRQNLLAYMLLCKGLQKEYGITEPPVFEYEKHGKPHIIGHPDIHFSISHCKVAVACVISDNPVGIDIESLRPVKESVIRYSMNEKEAEQIQKAENPNREFIKFWTQKEAFLKQSGIGINDNMRDALQNIEDAEIITTEAEHYIYSVCFGKKTTKME